jgi:hypothetical protein
MQQTKRSFELYAMIVLLKDMRWQDTMKKRWSIKLEVRDAFAQNGVALPISKKDC